MSVLVPWTRIARVAIRPVLFSGNQEGSLGGWTLPVPRLGDRFAVDVTTTRFRQDQESSDFFAALFQATSADARIALFQPGRPTGPSAGAPVVHGAGQSGASLVLRGLVVNCAIVRGQFFGILHGGVRYIHMATALAIAGSDGHITIPIWPMLRFLTVDGEACEIDAPSIEGQLSGFDKGAAFSANRVEPLQFTIGERG